MRWIDLRRAGRVVLAAAEVTLRMNVMDLFIIFTVLIQPLTIALLALWMMRERGADNAIYVVVGSGMTGLWSSLLYISGNSINVERWIGTLEALVGQPSPLYLIVFGKNLAHVAQSLGSMLVSYLVAGAVFGYRLQIGQPLLFAISLVLAVIAFVSFGLIIGPVFIINPGVQGWQNGLEFPIYILSGFLFPIAMLPGWTTPISYLLAPYWAARAMHGTSSGGASLGEVVFCWGMLLLFSALYIVVARALFRLMLRKVRSDATLGLR
jgi:ABC-2 type transport system permease protein